MFFSPSRTRWLDVFVFLLEVYSKSQRVTNVVNSMNYKPHIWGWFMQPMRSVMLDLFYGIGFTTKKCWILHCIPIKWLVQNPISVGWIPSIHLHLNNDLLIHLYYHEDVHTINDLIHPSKKPLVNYIVVWFLEHCHLLRWFILTRNGDVTHSFVGHQSARG